MMHARERLYLTEGRDQLVSEGDPKAAFLYAALGDEIPETAAAKFGLVNGWLQPVVETLLLGSSLLPALVQITADQSVQLGEVVRTAHASSGLSADEWNALPELDRETLLGATVEAMRVQQQTPPQTPPPAPTRPPRPPKKAAAEKAGAKKPAEPPEGQQPDENKEQPAAANKETPAPENKGA